MFLANNSANTTDATFVTITSQERLYDTTDIYDVEVLTVNGDQDDANFPAGNYSSRCFNICWSN